MFLQAGYDKVEKIYTIGLTSDNLDQMGITIEEDRSKLLTVMLTNYSENLSIKVTKWKEFGPVIVFTVVSRFQFYRSSACLQFSDFQKLDVILRNELQQDVHLSRQLPSIPVFSGKLCDLNHVQQSLHYYLTNIAKLVEGTVYQSAFLMFLDLIPTTEPAPLAL